MIETIRKTVKSLGNKVSFTCVTPEEKGRLANIVYTYKRQGIKTSENEINIHLLSKVNESVGHHQALRSRAGDWAKRLKVESQKPPIADISEEAVL